MVIFCGAELISAPQFLLPFYFDTAVHKDVTERLPYIDPVLFRRVQKILGINLSERHLRGGNATRLKYEKQRKNKITSAQNAAKTEKRNT